MAEVMSDQEYIERLEARVTGLEAMRRALGDPETLARRFHDTYERLAPSFMYVTREDTRTFDPTSKNGLLMVAVCREILADLAGVEADPRLALTADDLAAVSKHLARTPLFLSDTHVRVDVALRAALAAEGKDET